MYRGRVNVWVIMRAAAVLLGLSLGAGCDRRVEPFVPADQEPPPSERPVRIPGLEKARPRAQLAPGVLDAGAEISGSIALASGAAGAGSGVLFVIVRSGAAGPPLAVKRLAPGPFPIAFRIGPSDVMIQGREFSGSVTLTARLDRDGNPLTRGPDDLYGSAAGPVAPGSTGISILLEARAGG
ncbi:MAG: hypothetical protein O7A09_05510 [Proteobacteria bacterium]|nr:hypothetical protein [Pseudomonadota bacterium]